MRKSIVLVSIVLGLFLTGPTLVSAKSSPCVGICYGVNSSTGNATGTYKPRNTYVAPYVQKSTGKLVQGYTRSKP